MYMDEQEKRLQERMKNEGKEIIPKNVFLDFVKKYFLEHTGLKGNFDFITVSYKFFDKQHQVLDLNNGGIWINRPEERRTEKDIPFFITKDGYEKLEELGINHPNIPERMKVYISDLIEQQNLYEEITRILGNDGIKLITPEIMEEILRENGYTDIFFDHYFYSQMDMPNYNVYASLCERENIVKDNGDNSEQHTAEEIGEAIGDLTQGEVGEALNAIADKGEPKKDLHALE